jgi:hypothetical protein
MRLSLFSIIVLAAVAIATPGEACTIAPPTPERKIAEGYRTGTISAVAVVRIEKAGYTGQQRGDAHPWAATTKVARMLRGSYPAKTVRLMRGWGSAACDDGRPAPSTGDQWVVYFWRPPAGDQVVWITYPLGVAATADPNVRRYASNVR